MRIIGSLLVILFASVTLVFRRELAQHERRVHQRLTHAEAGAGRTRRYEIGIVVFSITVIVICAVHIVGLV